MQLNYLTATYLFPLTQTNFSEQLNTSLSMQEICTTDNSHSKTAKVSWTLQMKSAIKQQYLHGLLKI